MPATHYDLSTHPKTFIPITPTDLAGVGAGVGLLAGGLDELLGVGALRPLLGAVEHLPLLFARLHADLAVLLDPVVREAPGNGNITFNSLCMV